MFNSDTPTELPTDNQHLIPMDALKDTYERCKSITQEKEDKHVRGYVFQNLIYSILYHEGLDPRTSYRPKGEEIDGAFYLNHKTFLLEAKWTADPLPASDIYTFKGKVDGKLEGTLGIFISMNGYSQDAPDALEQGKTPNVILFDQSDMDAILMHGTKFLEVLDFKLRQAGEVGKTYVPFTLPKVVASATSTYTQPDVGYGKPLILVLCEGTTDSIILEIVLRELLSAKHLLTEVAVEIKGVGERLNILRKLPEVINIVQLDYRRQLSGVVFAMDVEAQEFSRSLELSKQVEEYVSRMAMPVPIHLALAMPSIEAWIGLDKASIMAGPEWPRIVRQKVNEANLDTLPGIEEFKAIIEFIEKTIEPDEPLWEADAREAVDSALEAAVWQPEKGIVVLTPLEDHQPATVCRSIDDLRSALTEIASIGATNSMPYEDGEPVFDIDYWGMVDEILIDDYEEQIREMGWTL